MGVAKEVNNKRVPGLLFSISFTTEVWKWTGLEKRRQKSLEKGSQRRNPLRKSHFDLRSTICTSLDRMIVCFATLSSSTRTIRVML